MGEGLQGGDLERKEKYFYEIIRTMPAKPCSCLDIGCGIAFSFEKFMASNRMEKDNIDCVDIRDIAEEKYRQYCKKYYCLSCEKRFELNKKYDCVFCLEVIEHIDKTDILLKNCLEHLDDNGLLFISCPNLASLYGRIELMLGYQPHVLEISNEYPNCGTGYFGRKNNPMAESIHHVRGITYRGMRELLNMQGFEIIKCVGDGHGILNKINFIYPLASTILYICRKGKNDY